MEELKLILETVAALGTEAKWAFFVWLAYKAGSLMVIAGGVLLLAHWIIRAIVASNNDEACLRAIANIVELRYYEKAEIQKAVAVLKHKAEKRGD